MLPFFAFFALSWNGAVHAAPTTRKVELVQDFTPPLKSGAGDLYIPLPVQNTGYQKVLSETNESNAAWVKEEDISFNNGKDKIRVLHAHWEQTEKPTLKVREILSLADRDSGLPAAHADAYFLQPTDHVQTDGIVKDTALKVTRGLKDPDRKAEAIYNWIVENTFRDPKTRGCGTGDVKSLLKSGNLGGKCADLNSLFVGMARAAGVPAREVWGLRVAASDRSPSLGKYGDVSKSQHCRAEYYSTKRKAWFPADPADIRKVILEEKLTLNDPHVKELRPRFFGSWEGNWVALNYGRDVAWPTGKKINYIMYPQLVSGDSAPDGMDPAEVGYRFTSRMMHD